MVKTGKSERSPAVLRSSELLALEVWLGELEVGLGGREGQSRHGFTSGEGSGLLPLVLWFPSGTVALSSLLTLDISSQFLFWGGLAFVPSALRIRRGVGLNHGSC